MSRPPRSLDSQLLFSRPVYAWIRGVNRKQEELAVALRTPEARRRTTQWSEAEFVYSTLGLEGTPVTRAEVERLFAADQETASPHVKQLSAALRVVADLAEQDGARAQLSSGLLCRLHSPTSETAPRWRHQQVQLSLEVACTWFNADSFIELHPIEQAGIALLRLLEIRPFDDRNQRTALVAASLFTMRRELPPLIIGPDQWEPFRAAVAEGLRISTRPMVELLAQAIETALAQLLRLVQT